MSDAAGEISAVAESAEDQSDAWPLGGRALRFVLVGELMKRSEATVAELVAMLAREGYVLTGRASKVVSDGLRWEVLRGRVVRVGRGRYRYRRAPASTARRIKIFGQRCQAWILAQRRGERPAPTPPDLRPTLCSQRYGPWVPPWRFTAWLWTT